MIWQSLCKPLATIEQYRISFSRNTMVVNDHFIREGTFPLTGTSCHTTFNCMKSDMQTQLKQKYLLVYSSALQ